MIVELVSVLALIGSCGFAWKWGGIDEKLTASALMVATVASNLADTTAFVRTETGMLVVDGLLFLGLVVLALRSDRFWPMWAAAFQLVGTMFHFASMTETGDFAWAYYIALIFWSYPVMIALGVGTWFEGRHRRRDSLS